MKLKYVFVAAAILGVIAAVVLGRGAQAQELPPASAGTVLVHGLLQPKGMVFGPDGMIYVAESGTGGDTNFTIGSGADAVTVKNGFTGRISKVDPDTGARTTVADGLPSGANPEEGEALGPADVAFIGDNLYLLLTHGGADWGFPDTPTGIYRVRDNGTIDLIADLGAFNKANPTEAISSGEQQDIEVGGNPYSMIVRNGVFYVSDGNHNHLTKVTTGGNISVVTEFPHHPVSTGIASTDSGPFYVAELGQGPFLPQDGKVVSVNQTSGAITDIASGASMITDVQRHTNGTLYALQFNDVAQAGDAFFAPGTGKVLKVNADGTYSPVITGLSFATFMEFDGDTLYIVNGGVTPDGSIIKVPNFSSVQPAAATPTPMPTTAPVATPTRPGGVTAPNTGTGGYLESNRNSTPWLIIVLGAAALLAMTGAAVVAKRR